MTDTVTSELAVVDAEVVEPLSEAKARQLDKRIRAASAKVADQSAALLDLLEQAASGQIHVALGFPSWTAWVKDAVQVSPVDAVERKALVSLMSGKGMSQRAIAEVVGANQATVSRDLGDADGDADASPEDEAETADASVGTDGKTYTRKKKKVVDEEPLDVEEVEPKRQPVSADFKDEMAYLANTVSSFNEIIKDERFPKARKTIAKNHLRNLSDHISSLQAIVDALMEE